MEATRVRINRQALEKFCQEVFIKLGISKEEAEDSAKILVSADARGIGSHGVARLWRYKNGIELGIMRGGVEPTVLRETPISRILDAEGGYGSKP